MEIDERIKQAQRRGAGMYVLGALLTTLVIGGVLSWLFLVQAYSLSVGPAQAQSNAQISKHNGILYVSGTTVYTLGGKVQVKVSADTYESAVVDIDADSPSNIEVLLKPSPAQLSLNIVNPEADLLEQSAWYIDDELMAVGASFDGEIKYGEYSLQVINPFFKPWSQTLNLQRAEVFAQDIRLEVFTGSAQIDSAPAGSEIYINGELKGQSPLSLALTGGSYTLSTKLEGYQAVVDTLNIAFERPEVQRNYRLKAVQASVNISAVPSGGVLLINNLERPLGAHELDANTAHSIRYQLPGYFSFATELTLSKGEQRELNIALKPEFGELKISANLEASLSINGQPQGLISGQVKSFSLPAKATQVVVSKPGYRSVQMNVVPTSKRSLMLDVELLTEFAARRKEGRPLYANQLGISLKKFSPEAYTMGSLPNETGRRRNEHLVKVDFDKDFWVSTTEITQAQFGEFSGNASSAKLPITNISWEQAALFTNWLSQKEGLPVFYKTQGDKVIGFDPDSTGYRLPTEAEWEWLAKKANRARSTVYVWGNQERIPNNAGNFGDKSASSNQLIFLEEYDDKQVGLAPVASFKADRIGLYDLAGNVSEWVHDFYTNKLPDTQTRHMNYFGATRGTQHVVKGGNFESGRLRDLRAAHREVGETPKANIGFRIARFSQQ